MNTPLSPAAAAMRRMTQEIRQLKQTNTELLEALEAMVKRIEYYSAIPESERPTIEQWEYTEGSTEMDKSRAAIAKAKP
jgi:hypothetical protein